MCDENKKGQEPKKGERFNHLPNPDAWKNNADIIRKGMEIPPKPLPIKPKEDNTTSSKE